MESSFEPKGEVLQIAKAYALDAIDFARENFKLTLDWSDSSIRHVGTPSASPPSPLSRKP